MKTRHHILAALAGIAVLAILVGLFRMRGWVPFALAGFAWAGLLLATLPRRRREETVALPDGVRRGEFDDAMATLAAAAARLRELAATAPPPDVPLFERMAELVEAIRAHHRASPGHLTRTRQFIGLMLGRMVDAASDYVDLARRAGPDQRDRLRAVSAEMDGFAAVLEKIDRACVDNDLTALEINVEVLGDQLDRRR